MNVVSPAILPPRYEKQDGRLVEIEPSRPCPELLTESEAIRYLRLDTTGISHPQHTLERYRAMGLLRGTQVGRRVFYRRLELERFLERQTDANPK
ncbi:MAG: helix-turn-helix domain-containing protein [Phycisphaeraceae bacterium]